MTFFESLNEQTWIYWCLPLVLGWILDLIFGDPARLPHPVVGMGKAISWWEQRWNRGSHRVAKGAVCAISLILLAGGLTWALLGTLKPWIWVEIAVQSILIFYCLAGTTLIREVKEVFRQTDISVESGRHQVARIVGRDTQRLSKQEIHAAALETLAENLSDGVIAPLFWYLLLGVPGMVAYKMVNTLDSMIGYRTKRYLQFGFCAARIDDFANWVPARLTAYLMLLVSFNIQEWSFVKHYGRAHLSPNSGWPEAALAGILNCRFGGPHDYFGEEVYKPYIGENDRPLTMADADRAIRINRHAEFYMLSLIILARLIFCYLY